MAKIVVTQRHQKSEEEVRALVNELEIKLVEKFNLDSRWTTDDIIEFKRSGLSGELCIEPNCVVISLKLGVMFGMYSKKIQSQLEKLMADNLS